MAAQEKVSENTYSFQLTLWVEKNMVSAELARVTANIDSVNFAIKKIADGHKLFDWKVKAIDKAGPEIILVRGNLTKIYAFTKRGGPATCPTCGKVRPGKREGCAVCQEWSPSKVTTVDLDSLIDQL